MTFLFHQDNVIFIFFSFFFVLFLEILTCYWISQKICLLDVLFLIFSHFKLFFLSFFFCDIFLMLKNNILLFFLTHVLCNFSCNRLFNVNYHVLDVSDCSYFMIVQMILILFSCSFINDFLLDFVMNDIIDMSLSDIILVYITLLL